MAIGSIVIDTDPNRTNSDICDDLLEHGAAIVEIGTSPTKYQRTQAISEELNQRPERWGKEEGSVLLSTYVVNSKGLICTYDTIDDLNKYDEFDVLFLSDVDGIGVEGVRAGIEKLTVEWRALKKPGRHVTHFELEDVEDED